MNRQFLFIKSATESIALPVDSFSHAEYTSATTISLYFDAKRSGKDASVKVVLTVTSGKAQDVMNLITGHVASSNAAVMKYDAVNSVFFSKNVTGITSITTTEEPTIIGADGADGQGVPTGGSQFQILRKVNGDDYNTEWDYADRVTLEVRFDEAVSKGDPLYITGFNTGQNRITVAKADSSDSAKMPSIGLAFADYSLNDNGQATAIGNLDDVNTQTAPHDFQEGDVLYVNAGGGLTNVKPTGTNLIQNVGKVSRRQSINGEIVVMAIGRSNDLPNIPDGQAWIGNASGVPTATTLATVATTGSYNDLSDQPTIPTDTNLGNTDLTLSGNRVVEMGSNSVDFQSSSATKFKIFNSGTAQGTSRFTIAGNGAVGGAVRLGDSSGAANMIAFQHPDSGSGYTLKLPTADGSNGQVMQTDGSGNLSFVSNGFPKPLTTLTGRFQFDADDDNRTIVTGNSSFGTNYYLWNTEVFDTVGSGTVDTTTQSISNTYGGLSFRVPQTAKVRWDWQHKPVNSSGYSLEYRAQIWSTSSLGSGIGGTNWTLRADEVFTSNTTTGGWLTDTVTTTSDISEGDYVMFVVGLNNQTISATAYLSFQSTATLTA